MATLALVVAGCGGPSIARDRDAGANDGDTRDGATTVDASTDAGAAAAMDAPLDTATDAAPTDVVCFFVDSNYAGDSFCVGPGAEGNAAPAWADIVSSVRVTPGYRVELFEDVDFQGRDLALIADQPHLTQCFMNDRMSSYRVSVDTPSRFRSVQLLRRISGCSIASGQHNDEKQTPSDVYSQYVAATTGQSPAMWSGDFGYALSDAQRWDVTHAAEAQWASGAIVHMMFHACPPTYAGTQCSWSDVNDSSYAAGSWEGNFPELLRDGSALNDAWRARLDELVPYLQYLEDRGVEVLFRPLHEMNQHYFWWSSSGPNGTAALFALTRDHLVNVRGLSNLAFVWDVQDIGTGSTGGSDFADYNPGPDNFDVAALDVYSDGYTNAAYYDALVTQASGRPVAIGETFSVPTPDVQQRLPQMAFFMIWAYGVYPPGADPTHSDPPPPGITVDALRALYADPRVVRLSDMPGWH